MTEDVYLVKVIQDIVSSMSDKTINYQPGSTEQITKSLNDLDNSITSKGKKYPLIAMVMPVPERRGKSVGFYAKVVIPKIVIATKSNYPTDDVLLRYDLLTGVFPTILYPLYYDFLYQCGVSAMINGQDPNAFEHTKTDYPNIRRLSSETDDWVDYMEISDLVLFINQIKNC
jgi:hypothetical protein